MIEREFIKEKIKHMKVKEFLDAKIGSMAGLGSIPVGFGLELQDEPFVMDDMYLVPYYDKKLLEEIYDGENLIASILQEAPINSLTFVGTSGLLDITYAMEKQPALFNEKVAHVVVMGGTKGFSEKGVLIPDGVERLPSGELENGAMNHRYHPESAKKLFELVQQYGIKFTVVTKNSAYAAMLPHSTLEQMGEIGRYYSERALKNAQLFWETCCKKELSPDRDRAFFVKVRLGGVDPGIPDCADVRPFLPKDPSSPVYDLLAGLLAVGIGLEHFKPVTHPKNTQTTVYGLSPAENGVSDPEGLVNLCSALLIEAYRVIE